MNTNHLKTCTLKYNPPFSAYITINELKCKIKKQQILQQQVIDVNALNSESSEDENLGKMLQTETNTKSNDNMALDEELLKLQQTVAFRNETPPKSGSSGFEREIGMEK